MPSLWGKLRVFSDEELYDLHCETLKVLENVGIGVHHDKVLERLEAVGLHVDFDTKVVKFPPEHIEETLRTCRIMDRRVPQPQKRMEFSAEGGPLAVIDLDTNQIRPSTLQDLADAVRLADALPNIDGIGEPVTPADVPGEVLDLYMYKTIWSNTTKLGGGGVMGRKGNVIHNREPKAVEYLLKLGAIKAGGWEQLKQTPLIGANMPSLSPLRFDEVILEQVLQIIEAKQYVTVCSNAMGGAQAPASLAGVLVVDNAEQLGGLAIVKALDPEINVFVCNHPGYMDMRTGNFSDGSPEHALLALGRHELLRYYGLHLIGHHPVILSLGKTVGVQAAVEKSVLAMLYGLMGATGICACGSLLYSYSLAQLVIDDEIAGMVNHILQGFEINEETLAYDVIKEVGVGGVYLDHPHTAQAARQVYWAPRIFDRNNLQIWKDQGSKDAVDRARERAKEILAKHHPQPLSEDKLKAMDELLKEARAELVPKTADSGP